MSETERHELGSIIWQASRDDEGSISATGANIVADVILAAGYRKPRTITSLADLDALPDGTVIRDNIGVVRERFDDEDTGSALWLRTGSGGWALSKQCHLPVTVLHEPEATK